MTQAAELNTETRVQDDLPENLSAQAMEHFNKRFTHLCGNPEDVKELSLMAEKIRGRWGEYGCDMISAFSGRYHNLDFGKLKKAVEAFVHSSSEDIQHAIEEFWWLAGLGDYNELLADDKRFEAFRRLMVEKGLEACKTRAKGIRDRINAAMGEKG